MGIFRTKPIAELGSGNLDGLRRVLGARDLMLLGISALIGAGIFGAIGTAAAGQTLASGEVVRPGAGP